MLGAMDNPDPLAPFAAVILAGGAGRRLGHVDKATVVVAGSTLLERAVAACAGAGEVVVVGPSRPDPSWREVRESPAGAGPVAALGAGLAALPASVDVVVVLAVDMPGVQARTVDRLVTALAGSKTDAAVLVGPEGRRQLAMAVHRAAVAPLVADPSALVDAPLWRTLVGLRWIEVAAQGTEHRDIDTPDDLARAQEPRTHHGSPTVG